MTYVELIKLCQDGEVMLASRSDAYELRPDEGLFIRGSHGDEFAVDILVRIEPNNHLKAWVRDPEGASEAEGFLGKEWCLEGNFDDTGDFVTWAHEW